jgi:hypothetical protein
MKRIGEILLGARAITEQVLHETLAYTKTHRVSFGTAILEMGAITEDALLRALSVQTGAPPASARDLAAVPPDLIRLVPPKLAEKHTALPFRKVGRTLYIAMAHPRNTLGGDEIAFLTGLSVVRHVAITARLVVALEKYYGILAPRSQKALVTRLDGAIPSGQHGLPPGPETEPADVPAVTKLPSGMFRIPLSDGPADPWKLASEQRSAVDDEEIVIETLAPATKSRSVLEPLDFIPDHSDEEPEPARDPREALMDVLAPRRGRGAHIAKDDASRSALATRLDLAHGTEEMGVAVLESLREKLDTVALFLVQGDRVTGWLARPELAKAPKKFSVPFSDPSFFTALRNTTGFFAGPCPDTAANRRILESIGVRYPAIVGVVPVTMRGKTVLFLLGEAVGGSHTLQIPFLRRHASMTALALEILALRKKLAAL